MSKKHSIIHAKINAICKRIDELYDGLEDCKDPVLRWNISDTISRLISKQSELCQIINNDSK